METNKCDDVRELLNRVHIFLSNLCRDALCDEHCSECIGASDIADDVYDLLHSPRRNCDVGTPEEQGERHEDYCEKQDMSCLDDDNLNCRTCFAKWAQMPYEGHEGAGK